MESADIIGTADILFEVKLVVRLGSCRNRSGLVRLRVGIRLVTTKDLVKNTLYSGSNFLEEASDAE